MTTHPPTSAHPRMTREEALSRLLSLEGLDLYTAVDEALSDSICLSICRTRGCDYTTLYEPDCRAGWCEACGEGTCESILSLAEIV